MPALADPKYKPTTSAICASITDRGMSPKPEVSASAAPSTAHSALDNFSSAFGLSVRVICRVFNYEQTS
ncbi:hypothetical protein [Rhodococcus sp. T2V]|uniref:hypothetical protein n=1 Tax=Rhodococcus sp. T2V TaxID=3034164 RepID=UPI0023E29282|nr:hypothetical protein [Rhodococcus sp. T2V]